MFTFVECFPKRTGVTEKQEEETYVTLAVIIAIIAIAFALLVYVLTSWYSLRHKRRMQFALGTVVNPTKKALLHSTESRQAYKKSDISDYFWVNGAPPAEEECQLILRLFWRMK